MDIPFSYERQKENTLNHYWWKGDNIDDDIVATFSLYALKKKVSRRIEWINRFKARVHAQFLFLFGDL